VSPRDLDEDDVRSRPGRGKSRPRTKERPRHESAEPGLVVSVDRGRFSVVLDDSGTAVSAIKARDLGRKGVVVGDRVRVLGAAAASERGDLARIISVDERDTVLLRTADDTDPVERVVVANADQLAIVSAVTHPEPRPGLIDRALVAAYDGGLSPLLVLTKTDLKDPVDLLALYAALDVPVVAVQRGGDLSALRERLTDQMTAFFGHSGVGKSTLVNALAPGTDRSTGGVNVVTGRGRHTSSSAIAIPLPEGGWIIDTPGIRSLGLAHVDIARIIRAFPDLDEGTAHCPRACSHDEVECGLDAWAGEEGPDAVARLESLRRLLRSRALADEW
jgi:ribosome biogenesis GTPase